MAELQTDEGDILFWQPAHEVVRIPEQGHHLIWMDAVAVQLTISYLAPFVNLGCADGAIHILNSGQFTSN